MAVISSLVLGPATKPCKNKICKSCGLYLNQAPIFDNQRKSSVFWVGLSAVQFEDGEEKLPLSSLTSSGALIHQIEEPYIRKIVFYKTNLVKCVPLKEGKIRYPLGHEMEKCLPNLEAELEQLTPNTVFLLGKQVSSFILRKFANKTAELHENFRYSSMKIDGINFIPIHHPSYILVYKRKYLQEYIVNVQRLFPNKLNSANPLKSTFA